MKKFLILTLIITFFLFGCASYKTVPSFKTAQQSFLENQAYVFIVIEYMCDTQYENIYISETTGIMLADLNDVRIENTSVVNAVKFLIEGKTYEYISKRGNTIYFQMAHNSHGCSSGIAYSISKNEQPVVQFMTECIPLECPNWYYYVADYNLWRTQN